MIRRILILLLPLAVLATHAANMKGKEPKLNYSKINALAVKQYNKPIRPGYAGRNPYWNVFSDKFIYAPAFDFQPVDGASRYRFVLTPVDGNGSKSLSFVSESANAPLSPVWAKVPVGKTQLQVEALDIKDNVIGIAGERVFFRDYPFAGPYPDAVREYRQAAIMCLLYIHRMPAIQSWLKQQEPDMSYIYNTYPAKIISATIRSELLLAKMLPQYASQAMTIAKNAAKFLMEQSRPEGEPLAFFPPTYYGSLKASASKENKSKTMTMEATMAGNAFLDLYDTTGDKQYYDHAIGIADTYLRLQRPDGSMPIKLNYITGEAVNDACAMLDLVLAYFKRLNDDYGIDKYEEARLKGEKWMRDVAVNNFDLTGQFEDVTVLNIKPYENLTNCTAATYATYLLSRKDYTAEDLADAIDLTHFCEDQFTLWDMPANADGFKDKLTPCVYEQFKWRTPVDNSAAIVANAMLSVFEATGEPIYWAKGKALADNLTIAQVSGNGQIPTTWDFQYGDEDWNRQFWINCALTSIQTLLRMDKLTSSK